MSSSGSGSKVSKMFNNMSVAELKVYLQERGVTINGYLKPALITIATAVDKMMLPVDPNFEKEKINGKLIIHDMEISDPFAAAHKLVNDFTDSPPFGLYDIFNYLIFHATDYDKQGLAAYKSFEDYRLFEDGYVQSLLTETMTQEGIHLYMGEVRPAMREKTDEGKACYKLWFILEGKGVNRGSVLEARCKCKGGRDGGCKHIAAAMYSLEELLNVSDDESPTSKPCEWVKKPTVSSKPCDVKDLQIGHREMPRKEANIGRHYCEHIDHDVRSALHDQNPPTEESLEKFTESLRSTGVKSPILPLLTKLHNPDSGHHHKPDEDAKQQDEKSSLGIMEEKIGKICVEKGAQNLEEISNGLCYSHDETKVIEEITKKQWKCKEWYQHKTGFITASKAHKVYTMQNSLDKGLKRNPSNIAEDITSQKVPPQPRLVTTQQPQNARDWGLKQEDVARLHYYRVECKKHRKLQLVAKGFSISAKRPFIGASLDNIRQCSCAENCPNIVVEYKCPWKHKQSPPKEAFLSPELGGEKIGNKFSLKKHSKYHIQVQVQMFVANLKSCDFVVWTEQGIFSVAVPYDAKFTLTILEQLQKFWNQHVLPLMVQKLDVNCASQEKINKPACKVKHEQIDIIMEEDQPCDLSIKLGRISIYQSCIDGLLPQKLVNDNIVTILLDELCCPFPVVSTFFYTVLSGDQEGTKKLSRSERNKKAEMFFHQEHYKSDYIFIPINRSFLQHLSNKFELQPKFNEVTYQALKVPQQEALSNNCGMYIHFFLKHFLQDLGEYESNAEDYCATVHDWFNHDDAETKRTDLKKYLDTMMFMQRCK